MLSGQNDIRDGALSTSDSLTFIFEHLVQLLVPVGRDDLEVNHTGDIQSLVLQQLQGRRVNELMGPFALLQLALSPDK